MEAIILNCSKKNKTKKAQADDQSKKMFDLMSVLNKDNITKVYLLYSDKDGAPADLLNKKQNYKFAIVPIKIDNSIDDLGVLSKINNIVTEQKIKNDIIIIVENLGLDSEFSTMLDYFEATKKPIILLKTANKRTISKNNEVTLDKNGFVKTIVEHPVNPKSQTTSAGVYFIPKDALFWIKKIMNTGANKTSFDFFIKRLSQKRKVRGIVSK